MESEAGLWLEGMGVAARSDDRRTRLSCRRPQHQHHRKLHKESDYRNPFHARSVTLLTASTPPALPAELSRPDAQMIVDALNLRLHAQEQVVPKGAVTALPASPVAGQQIVYKAAAGIYWNLIYTGEATYPWAKIGGPPLFAHGPVAEILSNTTETKSTTKMPSITLPTVIMEADCDWGSHIGYVAVTGSQLRIWLGLAGVYSENFDRFCFNTAAGAAGSPFRGKYRGTFTSAEVVNTAFARVVGSGEVQIYNPYLAIDPIRVG